jgi:CheY-like chemotaxis protein
MASLRYLRRTLLLSGRRKLLLADDSPTIQKVINLTFEDEEMEVVAVSDGEQALRILEEQASPDILLADIWMPGPNGYELCERVKRDERLRHVPVILLVGAFEPFNEAEARRVGADTVLTKPFQSIRDLVSKVGSLLGGGGPKQEEETPAKQSRRDESADEAMTLQADVPMRQVEENAPAGDSFGEAGGPFGHDAMSSFGDLGADDELIEAKPADSFGFAADDVEALHEDAAPADEPAHEPFAAQEQVVVAAQEQTFATHAPNAFAESGFEARAHEPVESVMAAPHSFAPLAASAAVADDALLDLGLSDAPASSVADDDDFVLDIDLDEPAPSKPWQTAPAQSDAPSAFAEAAHGGSAAAFNESVSPFERFEHSASSVSVQEQDAPVAEVVMQDEPQHFDSHEVVGAPRGFVEPSVVPADAPVPAMFEDEFTDGSVEGDVAKAPTGVYATQPVAEGGAHEPEAPPAPERFVPSEPATAGHAVGEARAGVEETLRADQLSPEAIDKIARRVVELMSDKVVREIAWEVVPDLAELLIKQKLYEERQK